MSESDPVVGHKTFHDENGYRHEPLRAIEADALWAAAEAQREKRREMMPDEVATLHMLGQVYQRLKELGWNDAIYCPKDGTHFDAIEFGSTGIHECHYSGDWPKGSWWISDDGDLWPSRPVMYRARGTK